MREPFLTLDQAAARLQTDEAAVVALIDAGALPAARLPFGVRIDPRALDRLARRRPRRPPLALASLAALAAALVPAATLHARQAATPLNRREIFAGDGGAIPPLDSSVTWYRRHTATNPPSQPDATHQILSLVADSTGKAAYPWPLYIQLTSAHDKGDATGVYVRLRDTGDGWGAAYHTDLYHDGGGTSIGANVEVTKKTDQGRAIGVNLQSKGKATDEGIQFQSDPDTPGWKTGLHFARDSKGTRAIWVEGKYDTGLDLGPNDLRLAPGAKLILDRAGDVFLTYNPQTKAIEFRMGDRVLQRIATAP